MQLLTHSRIQSFKTCRRQHWFAYEHGIRRRLDGRALRMGSAYHAGTEALAHGKSVAEACLVVRELYEADKSMAFDELDWEYERTTVETIVCCYDWRWQSSPLEYIAIEREFNLPLVNPAGGTSRTFTLGGKIDGIVRLEDGRLAVLERKLLGDDISADDALWRRLRIDQQITIYYLAARQLGYEVDCVLYEVSRKPTIKPTCIPILDDAGMKIVLDADNARVLTKTGKPRQTADQTEGYRLAVRDMRPDEWSQKLSDDIVERPQFYFARREVPRLHDDLREMQDELWDISKTIRDAQLNDRWFRTTTKNSCSFCSAFDLCTTGFNPARDSLPEGYERVANLHPELEFNNVIGTTATSTTEASDDHTDGSEAFSPATA